MIKRMLLHYVLEFKYVIALMVFVAAIGFIGEGSIVRRISQQEEIARLRQEILEQQEQYEIDRENLAKLKDDPETVRRIARERYFMKKASEDVYIIEDETEDNE